MIRKPEPDTEEPVRGQTQPEAEAEALTAQNAGQNEMNDEESLAAEYSKFTQVCTEVMDDGAST